MTRVVLTVSALLLGVLVLSGRTTRPVDAWAFVPEDPEGR